MAVSLRLTVDLTHHLAATPPVIPAALACARKSSARNAKRPKYTVKSPKSDAKDPKYSVKDPKYNVKDAKYSVKDPKCNVKDAKYSRKTSKFTVKPSKFSAKDAKCTAKSSKSSSRSAFGVRRLVAALQSADKSAHSKDSACGVDEIVIG